MYNIRCSILDVLLRENKKRREIRTGFRTRFRSSRRPVPGPDLVFFFFYYNQAWNQQNKFRIKNQNQYLETGLGPVCFRHETVQFPTLLTPVVRRSSSYQEVLGSTLVHFLHPRLCKLSLLACKSSLLVCSSVPPQLGYPENKERKSKPDVKYRPNIGPNPNPVF